MIIVMQRLCSLLLAWLDGDVLKNLHQYLATAVKVVPSIKEDGG